jgi:sugar (pentulose or hexulose) kinase
MLSSPHHNLYLGVDVGTTGTKAIVVDSTGATHGRGHAGYYLECPHPGQFVQDATDWQDAVVNAVRLACNDIDREHVVALSISAQGGTLVAVDREHEPLGPARSWLDRRATRSAETFARVFGPDEFYRRTGWPIAPNNTAAQLLDLASTDPEQFAAASWFCDTAGYLNAWLTGTPVMDANVGGITQLTNAGTASWDEEILEVIGVATARLPRIAPPGSGIGLLTTRAAAALGLGRDVVVGAGAQDQYCAALGAGAIDDGDILVSTGTAWVMLAVADAPYKDPAQGIGSGRHLVPDRWGHFGEVSNGGVSIEWALRLLNLGNDAPLAVADLDPLLESATRGADGLSFFPFFDGTSPFDSLETSCGSLLGLSLHHDHRHLLRAVAEGVVMAMRILLDRYRCSIGVELNPKTLVVVGGATRSPTWMQLLADTLGADILVSCEADAACLGAAILAATAAGHVVDTRVGAERMASPRTTVSADAAAARACDALFATYRRESRTLGELYSARPQSSPEAGLV